MARVVIVAGLSGAGKTTLLNSIGKGNYRIVSMGTLMKDIGVERGMVTDRDQIKRLPSRQTNLLRQLASRRFSSSKDNILLDTHLTIEHEPRLEPALPFGFISRLGVKALVYVNAPSKDVIARRAKDAAIRSRERQKPKDLDTQRAVDLSIMGYVATALNLPMYVINNNNGRIRTATKELRSAIGASFGE